ncbi:unnamed protein product [Blepharisma stoltei]|uniref:Glycosyl transferase family 28 C-terminal domain-containing protein n=1 Tax=Blepharisma stoltei TaxID=1481888 RepID=A0AAU9K3G2_9CILI|nr:unnamed protein product [Blepharisma stoltei]
MVKSLLIFTLLSLSIMTTSACSILHELEDDKTTSNPCPKASSWDHENLAYSNANEESVFHNSKANHTQENPKKMKIVIIGSLFMGHITPTIDMTKSLISRGHEITYYAPIQSEKLLQASGAKFIPYPNLEISRHSTVDGTKVKITQIGLQLMHILGSFTDFIMPWFKEMLDKESFDAIIFSSFTIWGNTVTNYLKKPFLCFEPSIFPAETEFRLQTHFFDDGKEEQAKFAEKLHDEYNSNGKNLVEMLSCSYAEKILMFSPQKFLEKTVSSKFPNPNKYIFLHSISSQTSKNPIPELKENSLIYFSLGTLLNERLDIFGSIIEFFCSTKYKLIISSGGNENLYQEITSKYHCDNIEVKLFTSQLEVLQEAAIFISHSGLNSVREAVSNTVPMITIPQGADQFVIARSVTELGLGVSFEDYEGSLDDKIKLAFNEIESNFTKYKENLKRVQKTHFDGQVYEDSMLEVENYLLNITHKL